jgi:hypothetical protein
VRLKKRLLRLPRERLHEARARVARAHQEQEHLGEHAREHNAGAAPVNLGLHAGLVAQGHEHLIHRQPQRAATLANIPADLPLGHIRAMLLDQAPVDPLRRVPLLTRRRLISDQP